MLLGCGVRESKHPPRNKCSRWRNGRTSIRHVRPTRRAPRLRTGRLRPVRGQALAGRPRLPFCAGGEAEVRAGPKNIPHRTTRASASILICRRPPLPLDHASSARGLCPIPAPAARVAMAAAVIPSVHPVAADDIGGLARVAARPLPGSPSSFFSSGVAPSGRCPAA
jgi:hypothetical protein